MPNLQVKMKHQTLRLINICATTVLINSRAESNCIRCQNSPLLQPSSSRRGLHECTDIRTTYIALTNPHFTG